MPRIACGLLCLLLGGTAGVLRGDDWSHWRGPLGNGVAPEATPPVEFGAAKNVRWKVEIPGRGSSSPVIHGDRVFVTTAVPVAGKDDTFDFRVICFDRATGKERWSRLAVTAKPHEGTHQTNGFASASPSRMEFLDWEGRAALPRSILDSSTLISGVSAPISNSTLRSLMHSTSSRGMGVIMNSTDSGLTL